MANVKIDGLWEATYANRQGDQKREMFEFESRGGDLFGSNWVHGGQGKFSLVEGKAEAGRLKFCIVLPMYVRKGDGWEHITYRECFDGVVAGDEIRFIATTYIDHPTLSPETRRFAAHRVVK